MENSPTSSKDSSVDSTLSDGLTGNTGMGINIIVPYGASIGVSNPGHLPLARARVWGRYINARTNKALLCQLHGEPPCDVFQFIIGIVLGIDLDTSFGTPKWHIDHCTLICHQRSQSFYFIYTHISAVTDTSLAGRAVQAVLGPVALDDLPGAAVAPDAEGQAQHVVAGLDDPQDATHPVPLLLLALPGLEVLHQLVLHDASAAVEETVHRVEEVGVVLAVGRRLAVVSPAGRRRRRRRRAARGPGPAVRPSGPPPSLGLRARRGTAAALRPGTGTWPRDEGRGGDALSQARTEGALSFLRLKNVSSYVYTFCLFIHLFGVILAEPRSLQNFSFPTRD